jgi:hypothetical protein
MRVPFSEVAVGQVFRCNGNTCVKQSTRTAWILNAECPFADSGRWFYFGQKEVVHVGKTTV